jgi:hypothetical protein
MFILYYILCLIVGVLVGVAIRKNLKPKCVHNYKLINNGEIVKFDRNGDKIVVGFMKVYECEHCKVMNAEKVYVD